MKRVQELPEKFIEEMKALLETEEELGQYMASFEEPQSCGLRVNTLRWNRDECRQQLPCSTTPVPWIPNGLFYDGSVRLSRDPYYYAGLYYLQEPSAMTPASVLDVHPGEMVLDLCAAPGGKSTELGARLKGQGMLVANDISNSRAKALLKNLELMGISNSCVVSETPQKLAGVFPEFFDKILVDAPCSGEGMFRKDPDMIKDWKEKGPEYYCGIQKEIAGQAVKMLKAGGSLLYSTCTFSRMEDEDVVRWILDNFPEMELVPLQRFEGACDGIGLSGCIRLFPHKIQGEGHFIALLRKREREGKTAGEYKNADKNAGQQSGSAKKKSCTDRPGSTEAERMCLWQTDRPADEQAGRKISRPKDRQAERPAGRKMDRQSGRQEDRKTDRQTQEIQGETEFLDFLKETRLEWDMSRIRKKEDMIFYLPQGLPEGTGLRFLRTGLFMGTVKNGRFEPSQPMAMVLGKQLYSNCVSFDREDERVIRYLKGETICLTEGEESKKGWCLVCVDGFALGFAKGNGMTLKNKYYPGWRWQ